MANVPSYDHIVVVVEENHSESQIIGNSNAPFINNTLVKDGALMTNYSAITHPSEPNYFALYAGSTFGVTDDGDYSEPDPSLATVLNQAGKSFTGYVEAGSPQKHNPWESFPEGTTVEKDFSQFPTSNFASLPSVSFVVPNLNDDMHDGTVQQGDQWLQQNLSAYEQWAKANNSLLVVTWDENDGSSGNKVPTILDGAGVTPGQYSDAENHYDLLSTIAAAEGVTAPRNGGTASPITSPFTAAPPPPPPPPPTGNPADVVTGTGSDSLVLKMSEDAANGDAQFTVKVDGVQQGGTFTTTALNSSSQTQNFIFNGDWTPGTHTVAVTFLNDFYNASTGADRNLTLDDVIYDGKDTGIHKGFPNAATKSFSITDTTAIPTAQNVGNISINDVTIAEGNSGTKTVTFTVSRTGTSAFSVNYATADGTATAGSDYQATSGTLNFAAGQASQTVSVTINGDTTVEPDETFSVNLSAPTNGGVITDGQGIGTITNDDSAQPPPPPGTVNITPGMDIQAAINNNPTGTTFKFAAGTYTGVSLTPKDGDVFDGTAGAILDGKNSTVHAFQGSAQNVTINGFTIQNYTAPAQDAPVHGDSSYGWIVENNTIQNNAGGGVDLGNHMQVLHNNINHNLQIGIDANNLTTATAQNITVDGNDIGFNNYTDAYDPAWEAGGTKFWATTNLRLTNNNVHDNHGPGLWMDTDNIGSIVEGNTVSNNTGPGIMSEVSYDAEISGNLVKNNDTIGTHIDGWPQWAGILVFSSGSDDGGSIDVSHNMVVGGKGDGISFIQQDRSGDPAAYGPHTVQGVHVHDNTIDVSGGGEVGGSEDIGSQTVFSAAAGNWFQNNTYYLGNNSNAFNWVDQTNNFAWWQGKGQDTTGSAHNTAIPADVLAAFHPTVTN